VVVAAGNDGDSQFRLDSPAIDPYVVAVGAADSLSDPDPKHLIVPAWSATGNGVRNPSIVAAGRSIASYRVPGSTIDNAAPNARHGDEFFRGSGTSPAAAFVSGVAALAFSNQPRISVDDLKLTMIEGRINLQGMPPPPIAGKGLVNAKKASTKPRNADPQAHPTGAGTGTGILSPTGARWSGGTCSGATWSGNGWS
jgi:serine protease AprX